MRLQLLEARPAEAHDGRTSVPRLHSLKLQAGGLTCLDRWTFRGVQPISRATISSVIGPW